MGAKVKCRKGYNTKDGYVEFKTFGDNEVCPVSNAEFCERCDAEVFESEKKEGK